MMNIIKSRYTFKTKLVYRRLKFGCNTKKGTYTKSVYARAYKIEKPFVKWTSGKIRLLNDINGIVNYR